MPAAPTPSASLWPTKVAQSGLTNFITPYAMARSAIFSTQVYRGQSARPRYLEKTPLTSVKGMSVFQLAGEQLDQNDADVFYELLRRVIAQGDGSAREARVQFNRTELLTALGRARGGKTVKLLSESLARLTDATFYFEIPGLFTGRSRLILKALTAEEMQTLEYDYDVLIDVELSKLLAREQWAFLRKKERDSLAGDPLAKGLHAYYATHKDPYPVRVDTLRWLMGRQTMHPSKFKKALTDSLANLKSATGWHTCEIVNAGGDMAKVCVVKKPPQAKKPVKTSSSSQSVANHNIKAISWDAIQSPIDLVHLSANELVALMDDQAKSEWAALSGTHNTRDEGSAWEAARGILERQCVALIAVRYPGTDPYDI
ncbi:plasmid replication initiator TrfA [Cupriavidus metallidurans]|uniref:plasmid replication initiator TrfA n=1 Tax=Cupriavidus metallidurans TaxID=119219 RepID=UPI001CCBBD29|nr:plasmid replication initiator TrfA [Cupriavidus metallidurans]UBM09995.1 hypothetical protein LAI70_22230 [Cupriavidus metallidurans]